MNYRIPLLLLSLGCCLVARAALPAGWSTTGNGPQHYSFDVDSLSVDGRRSAVISAKEVPPPGQFGSYVQSIAADDYRGTRLRLTAKLRTEDAARAQMWMRVDGRSGVLAFDNMDSRPVTGTTGWKEYDIVLDVADGANAVFYGFFLMGKGKVWADGFKLVKVGRDVTVTGTPTRPRVPSNLGFEE
jgi:AraC family transcriptional regulator